MTVIYSSRENRAEARRRIKPEPPYVFASPTDTGVDHSATKVFVVGNHPHIAEGYKGIAKVETIDIKPKDSD